MEERQRQTTNNDIIKGGKFLASGSYGAVFKPPITCKKDKTRVIFGENNSKQKDAYVGKVFLDDNDFRDENFIMGIVNKKFKSFAIPMKYACEIEKPTKTDLKLDNRQSNKRDILAVDEGMNQIVYPNGGDDLHTLFDKCRSLTLATRIKWAVKIFKSFKPIIEGLILMKKEGIIHNDIKPANIVFNKKTNKAFIIDWGMAYNTQNIYTSIGTKDAIYPYYVPDYKIVSHLVKTSGKTFPSIENIVSDNIKGFGGSAYSFFNTFGCNLRGEAQTLQDYLVNSDIDTIVPFFNNFSITIDIYAIGITLAHILIGLEVIEENKLQIHTIRQFIGSLIHIDPRVRLPTEEVVSSYNRIYTMI